MVLIYFNVLLSGNVGEFDILYGFFGVKVVICYISGGVDGKR